MPDANDMELVRDYARHNSGSAFAELVRRHINLVYSVALRFTGNPGDAEDVTQAVFVILARKAAGLRASTILTGWLYETTRLTASSFLRGQNRRRMWEQEAVMQSNLTTPESDNLWRQLAPHLEAAMSRLAERDRTLLALRFYGNKTGAEAAALLGIRETAAHKRTARALEKLRSFFSKRGVDSTAAVIANEISVNSIQAAPVALVKTVTAVAVAKGASASISTLTLIKGALKVMAWTKAKTAIGAGVGVLLVAGMTTLLVQKESGSRPKQEQLLVSGSPVAEPSLSAWQNGDKSGAISKFVEADWAAGRLFASGSVLGLSEKQFAALTGAQRQAALGEFNGRLAALKQVAAAVAQAGRDAAANGDKAQARKYFTALEQCGTALASAGGQQIVQLVGKAFKKMADAEMSKLGP